jgi:hypothetical protein
MEIETVVARRTLRFAIASGGNVGERAGFLAREKF